MTQQAQASDGVAPAGYPVVLLELVVEQYS